jgi:preprotein translocase subunit YajC
MFNFISSAYASDAATTAGAMGMGGDMTQTMVMLGVFAVLVYFILLRPQNKRVKAHRDLITGLEVGDEVTINGGIMGRVTKLTDDFISLSIADNVEIKCQRQAVTAVLPKGTLKTI